MTKFTFDADISVTRPAASILSELNLAREAVGLGRIAAGSYTRAKMVEMIQNIADQIRAEASPSGQVAAKAQEEAEEPAANEGHCPLCNADPSSITAAGLEGTFLGDSCGFCHSCCKTFNLHSGEEIPEAATTSKKRRILNPQTKINAKAEALAKIGIEQFYDKPARVWTLTSKKTGALVLHLSSRDYAAYSVQELVAYVSDRTK